MPNLVEEGVRKRLGGSETRIRVVAKQLLREIGRLRVPAKSRPAGGQWRQKEMGAERRCVGGSGNWRVAACSRLRVEEAIPWVGFKLRQLVD